MTMNPVPRKMTNEDTDLIKQFLDNGGVVSKKKPFERTEDITYTSGFYGRRPKAKTPVEEEKNDDDS